MTVDEPYGSSPVENEGILASLPAILWQRRRWIAIPVALSLLIGLALAFLLPPLFRSTATLLVESAQLPSELVGKDGANGNLIDKRIAKIRQQVLSRSDLIQLINTNNLYARERETRPLSQIIEAMRAATRLEPVSADIGGSGANTIAFSLSFDYPDANKAQLVTQDFVARLMNIDASQTAAQAAGAVEFLDQQATALSTEINGIEQRIQAIKGANGAALAGSGMMLLPSGGGGNQSQVAALQRENAQLQAQINLQASAADRDPAVVAAEAQLAGARAVYTEGHPDVRLAEQRLAEAQRVAKANIGKVDTNASLRTQIAANNAAIANLVSAQGLEQARASQVLAAQARAPAVNEQVAQLQARADGLRVNYQTVATNLLNARGAAKLSEQQKGERLSVVDPPVVADRPFWPNRPLVFAAALLVGLVTGLGLAFALELILRPIRGVGALEHLTGAPPLVVIPDIKVKKLARGWLSWRIRRRAGA